MQASPDGLYIETMSGQDIIFYNDEDINYKRINMTILHEIGHCVLDHTGSPEKKEEEEAEACFFAKYAAAPPPLVHREEPSCPEELADIFDISFTAAYYAFDYYHKWLTYGADNYTDYELRLLSLFESA
jgi:Zn-dependent peptidase ImmA (M78 family)